MSLRIIIISSILLFLTSCSGGSGGSGGSSKGVSCFHAAFDLGSVRCSREDGAQLGEVFFAEQSSGVRPSEGIPVYQVWDRSITVSGESQAILVLWGNVDSGYRVQSLISDDITPDSSESVRVRVFNALVGEGSSELSVSISEGPGEVVELFSGETSEYFESIAESSRVRIRGAHNEDILLSSYAGKTISLVVSGEPGLFSVLRVLEQ